MKNNRNNSFWYETYPAPYRQRPALTNDHSVDVAIIGAGYTGLWSAYYLKRLQPTLNVAIIEASSTGFGASGRNGGWVSGFLTGIEKYLAPLSPDRQRECCKILFDNVDDIEAILKKESIDANFKKGGVIYAAARYPEQIKTQQNFLKQLLKMGHSEEDCQWLNAQQLADKINLRNGYGGIYKPHCATVNPVLMLEGLANTVEKMGVVIYENTPARSIQPRAITTAHATLRATTIIPALEGYTSSLKGFGNHLIPVQSLIIATEPICESKWQEIGLNNREAFSDASRMVTYGQRSADNRMIFGARGGYHFGGRPQDNLPLEAAQFKIREALMHDLFPMLKGVKITHGWGGSLGVARNFASHVVYDSATGIATAGGYGGQGVGAAHLFGKTLADLILKLDTPITQMPWVFNDISHHKQLRKWEPEPFRWLTAQTISQAFQWEENLCQNSSTSPIKKAFAKKTCDALALLMR